MHTDAGSKLQTLLNIIAAPPHEHFDSVENGRYVYKFSVSDLAAERWSLVWYSPEVWWAKFYAPQFELSELGGNLEEIADNGVAKRFFLTGGPLSGFEVSLTQSGRILGLWSPKMPRVSGHAGDLN